MLSGLGVGQPRPRPGPLQVCCGVALGQGPHGPPQLLPQDLTPSWPQTAALNGDPSVRVPLGPLQPLKGVGASLLGFLLHVTMLEPRCRHR